VQVYSPYSYDAIFVIAEAIKACGQADRAAITAAMPATALPGLTGTSRSTKRATFKNGAISMFKVKDGKLDYISTSR